MSKKQKTQVKMVVNATPYERGDQGKEFHIASYRFPLKPMQAFERRAIARGMTRSMLLNRLVDAFVAKTEDPKGVKAVGTAHPTIWDKKEKKAYLKKHGLKELSTRGASERARHKVLNEGKPAKPSKSKKVEKSAKKTKPAKPAKTKSAKPSKKAVAKKTTKKVEKSSDILNRLKKVSKKAA